MPISHHFAGYMDAADVYRDLHPLSRIAAFTRTVRDDRDKTRLEVQEHRCISGKRNLYLVQSPDRRLDKHILT